MRRSSRIPQNKIRVLTIEEDGEQDEDDKEDTGDASVNDQCTYKNEELRHSISIKPRGKQFEELPMRSKQQVVEESDFSPISFVSEKLADDISPYFDEAHVKLSAHGKKRVRKRSRNNDNNLSEIDKKAIDDAKVFFTQIIDQHELIIE